MRMRKRKNLAPRMAACGEYLETEPQKWKGRWQQRMPQPGTVNLEIGCGKGAFVTQMAQQHPEELFVAVEREESVLVLAMEKAKGAGLQNVIFLSAFAERLEEMFAPDEVSRIYLNFSDPWPHKKQNKRRLTHGNFLKIYMGFLKENGEICFKTDNRGLFEDSLCYLSQFGFGLYDVTFDLHSTDTPNVMTEYETNFSQQGMPIYRCVARMHPPEATGAESAPEGGISKRTGGMHV